MHVWSLRGNAWKLVDLNMGMTNICTFTGLLLIISIGIYILPIPICTLLHFCKTSNDSKVNFMLSNAYFMLSNAFFMLSKSAKPSKPWVINKLLKLFHWDTIILDIAVLQAWNSVTPCYFFWPCPHHIKEWVTILLINNQNIFRWQTPFKLVTCWSNVTWLTFDQHEGQVKNNEADLLQNGPSIIHLWYIST